MDLLPSTTTTSRLRAVLEAGDHQKKEKASTHIPTRMRWTRWVAAIPWNHTKTLNGPLLEWEGTEITKFLLAVKRKVRRIRKILGDTIAIMIGGICELVIWKETIFNCMVRLWQISLKKETQQR
jgi:hypothetical protein